MKSAIRMKRLHLILLITLISNSLYAQSDNYKLSITNFQSNYNAENMIQSLTIFRLK
jgi:hypothetical protein